MKKKKNAFSIVDPTLTITYNGFQESSVMSVKHIEKYATPTTSEPQL